MAFSHEGMNAEAIAPLGPRFKVTPVGSGGVLGVPNQPPGSKPHEGVVNW